MALNSSRLLIAQGLVSLLGGINDPSTSLPLYSLAKLGNVFDPSGLSSWIEVTFYRAKSGPAGSGGNLVGWRIEDNPIFKLTSGWPYQPDSTVAMTAMLNAMDIVMPILHSHYQIPNPNSPTQAIASIYSLLEDQVEHAMPVRFPNGNVYLLWETYCMTKQQYNVELVNP